MIEKVNLSHPDKLADRIAGAIVDLAYSRQPDPRIAVEVLLGHGHCYIILESSLSFCDHDFDDIVLRIAGPVCLHLVMTKQDPILASNQSGKIRCGDNGIFKGVPVTTKQKELSRKARLIYSLLPYDGKYIQDKDRLIICQSHAKSGKLKKMFPNAVVNPLGDWMGGIDTDAGATNRKLGSDMADSVTGGGLHGKDLSKADVSVNIYAFLKAQTLEETVELSCAIGDEKVDGRPYTEIVEIARKYIGSIGGFEKLAEWGLF